MRIGLGFHAQTEVADGGGSDRANGSDLAALGLKLTQDFPARSIAQARRQGFSQSMNW